MLGSFATVAEAKAALAGGDVKVWLPKLAFLGNVEFPMHFIFFDKTGEGIVVEFMHGKMNVYDNPVGVVTNLAPSSRGTSPTSTTIPSSATWTATRASSAS